MSSSINGIEQLEPITRNEKAWFSIIKQISEDTNFGSVELRLVIKAGKVMSINNIKAYNSFNCG